MNEEFPELVLVTSDGDWGDELNLEGFAIYPKELWEHLKEGIPDKPHEAYYGSNEFVCFDGKEDYLSYLTEGPILLEEAELLLALLGKKFPSKEFFLKYGFSYGLFVINSDNK